MVRAGATQRKEGDETKTRQSSTSFGEDDLIASTSV